MGVEYTMSHLAGSWIVASMVKDVADTHDLPLESITWLPDPVLEWPTLKKTEDTNEKKYALVILVASTLLQKTFSRQTLQKISESRLEQERVKTELGALLTRQNAITTSGPSETRPLGTLPR
jgi:hypothetical protein